MVLSPKVLVIAVLLIVAAVAILAVMCLFSDFFGRILFFFFNIYLFIWLSLVLCGTWTLSYGIQDLPSCDIWDQVANIHWIIERARVPGKYLLLLY